MTGLLLIGDGPLSAVLTFLDVTELSMLTSSTHNKIREISQFEWDRRDRASPVVGRSVANSSRVRVQRFAMAQSLAMNEEQTYLMSDEPLPPLAMFRPSIDMAAPVEHFVRFSYRHKEEAQVIWEGFLLWDWLSPLSELHLDMSFVLPEMKWHFHDEYQGIAYTEQFHHVLTDVAITIVAVSSPGVQLVMGVKNIWHMGHETLDPLKRFFTLGPRPILTSRGYSHGSVLINTTADGSPCDSFHQVDSLRVRFHNNHYAKRSSTGQK